MILNTVTTVISVSCLLTVCKRSSVSSKIVSCIFHLYCFVVTCCSVFAMIAGIFVNILSNNLLDKKNENKEVALACYHYSWCHSVLHVSSIRQYTFVTVTKNKKPFLCCVWKCFRTCINTFFYLLAGTCTLSIFCKAWGSRTPASFLCE
jgi:hypothetical protein